ncbi:MAG: antibiotic biosynthesis monooxygenase [Gammaproteobacteria bacterium]
MKALPIHEGAFTVLLVFECKPRESEALAEQLADFIETRTRFHPGFLSALVYLTEDATKVVEFFQWARAEDWEAYRRSEDGRAAVRWLAGRTPSIQFLELVRALRNPPPGDES